MLTSSLAEIISLAAVLPFLAVLANPEELWRQKIVQQIAPFLGFLEPRELLLPITISFALAAIIAAAIRLLNLKLRDQFASALGSDISCEAYNRTIYQPYAVHLSRNSSTMISGMIIDIDRTVGQIFIPSLQLLSSLLIIIGLAITLIAINWAIAIGTGFLIVFVYLFAVQIAKKQLIRLGKEEAFLQRQLIQALQESLGAIREILLDGSQDLYTNLYKQTDRPLRRAACKSGFLSAYPRLALEPVGMVVIAVAGYILVIQGGVTKALPLLGALALGAQRILPMAQKVYEGWAQVRTSKVNLANVLNLLNQPLPIKARNSDPTSLSFSKSLKFNNVRFSYGDNFGEVLKGVNMEIFKGERIGLVGVTGSGKSTTIDLLIGLLVPSSGQILLDNQDLHELSSPERLAAWRRSIAHVPQSIYLIDSSIAENIAFGVPKHLIDIKKVKKAAEKAKLSRFISQCPNGYYTHIGERGVRLSGGQKQRIGIARAIYKEAKLIVFDEATSALDTQTEQEVMRSLYSLSSELTIILIAHRESTLKGCDKIIRIANGVAEYE
ncbi:ABC transporter ATP-binding protein [Prochlorococcus sp. MIT 1341]|uniref:ABC transporter ATP-binding protein n=1 Tax=Prochlorococcus sp. MIT 1341 TaxID=3096221 RepID=UPI002A755FB5|nr:ABC transporter ATP-binding protein [Prochlorococcus sp. MIT 1341]